MATLPDERRMLSPGEDSSEDSFEQVSDRFDGDYEELSGRATGDYVPRKEGEVAAREGIRITLHL